MTTILKDKNILLGVTGGIAAYKLIQVARDLTKAGAHVHVLMTPSATRFVTPLTFATLTRQRVHTDVWEEWTEEDQGHISLSERADMFIVAPATANTLAEMAHGLADDVLTTTYLALPPGTPVLIAPAMNRYMFAHPATQQNIQILTERGAKIIDPEYGMLASEAIGQGRLAEPAEILATIKQTFGQLSGDLRGKRLVITAGGTHEPIDPVRFIGNGSSGQMGYALAENALERGATVTLISGPVKLEPPFGCEFVPVQTALDMQAAVHRALDNADVLIMAAAVADFRPASSSDHKIKKDKGLPTIELTLNPDILASIKDGYPHLKRVGFAAETDDLIANAQKKLLSKNLDLIVANDAVTSIGMPDNEVTLISRTDPPQKLGRMPKEQVAAAILDKVLSFEFRII